MTNDGDIPLTNIKVDDELTGDHWTIESLDVGATETFTATYVVTEADGEAGSVTNKAVATPEEEDVPPGEDEITVPTKPAEKSPHITVNKIVTNTPKNGKAYTVGETISYKVTVINDGDVTVTDIKVEDALTGDKWTIDSLDPGAEKSFTTSYKVTEADSKAGYVTNVAKVTGPDVPNKPGIVTVTVEKTVEPPKTGDTTPIIPLAIAMMASLCGITFMASQRRRAR